MAVTLCVGVLPDNLSKSLIPHAYVFTAEGKTSVIAP